MRLGHVVFSASHFLLVFFVFSVGVLFFLIPYAPTLRLLFTTALMDHPEIVQNVGLGIFFFGGVLSAGLYVLNRHRYLKLKMNGYKVSVEEEVVCAYVQRYFKEVFPDYDLSTDVIIKGKNHLEILADLPTLQEDLLEMLQNELGILFHRRLGYQREFSFTVKNFK